MRSKQRSLDPVIRGFLRDDHVVDVRFFEAGGGDLHEARVALQFADRAAAGVTHSRAQPADELRDERRERAFVSHAAFDAFGHQFALGFLALLGVTVLAPLLHRRQAAHSAVRFEVAALIQNDLAGRFVDAREQRADHHGVGAGRDGLGDVAGIFNASVGDHRDARTRRASDAFRNGRDLRHARACDHASCTNRTGTYAALDRVRAGLNQDFRAVGRADVAGDQLYLGETPFDELDGFDHAGAVAVRRVDGKDVYAGFDQFRRALQEIASRADGRGAAQTAQAVFRRVRIFDRLLNVFDRDQALEVVVLVDDQQLLHAVFLQDAFGLAQRGADRNGDQVLPGHHFRDRQIEPRLEAQVAVGQDADEPPLFGDDRHARNLVSFHNCQRFADFA